MPRTRSGRWRAVNMMSTAPTKGAHAMIERTGQPLISLGGGLRPPSEPPPRTGLGRQSRRSNSVHHIPRGLLLGGGLRPPSEPPPRTDLRRQSRRSNSVHHIPRGLLLGGGLRPPSEPPPRTGLRRQSRRSNSVHHIPRGLAQMAFFSRLRGFAHRGHWLQTTRRSTPSATA